MPSNPAQVQQLTVEASFIDYRSTGSSRGLSEALQRVRPELIRLANYQLRQWDAAEDVVQATLLTAIEQAQAFDPERRLIPWLAGILQNKILSHRRRQARALPELDQERFLSPSPAEELEAKEVQALVAQALDKLPHRYRDVLNLHLIQGLGGCEIAARLDRPEGTIRAQIHRGLAQLRHLLPSGIAMSFVLMRRTSAQAMGAAKRGATSLGRVGRLVKWIGPGRLTLSTLAFCLGAVLLQLQRSSSVVARSGFSRPSQVQDSEDPGRLLTSMPSAMAKMPQRTSPDSGPARLGSVRGPHDPLLIQVQEKRSGEPQAGVQLQALWTDQSGARKRFEGQADERGQLELPLAPARVLQLSLQALGSDGSSARASWDRAGSQFELAQPLLLQLIGNRPIGGRVLDQEQQPIAGAQVKLHLTESLNDNGLRPVAASLVAITDALGHWNIDAAPEYPTTFQFSIFHPDYVPQLGNNLSRITSAEELWDGEAVVHLRSGVRTSLRIADLGGITIQGSMARISERLDPAHFGVEMTPDPSGLFHFTASIDKPLVVTASAPGFGQDQKRFPPGSAGADLVWRMEPRTPRRIKMVGPNGSGLAGALVRPFSHDWSKAHTSDEDGYVTLELRSDSWTLFEIQRPNIMGRLPHLVWPADETIQMPSPLSCELEVRDQVTGEALQDYEVSLLHRGRFRRVEALGTDHGDSQRIQFHRNPSRPGQKLQRPLIMRVERPGYLPFESEPLASEAFPAHIRVELAPAKSLNLVLLAPNGEEAKDATLVVMREGQGAVLTHGELSTDSVEQPLNRLLRHGRATLTLPGRPFTLVAASDAGFLHLTRQELLALGEEPRLELRAWSCVEGSAEPEARVELRSAGQLPRQLELRYNDWPSPDGSFHFCQVPEGRVRLSTEGSKHQVSLQTQPGSLVGPVMLSGERLSRIPD